SRPPNIPASPATRPASPAGRRSAAPRLRHQLGAGAAFRRLILIYIAWGSPSISVETNRRIGDSVDSFEEGWVHRENKPGETFAHMLGQGTMGNGASTIEGGISPLNFITAALDLNSAH